MPKLTLSDVTNLGGNPVSAQQVINTNSDRIEVAIEKTLSRDGTSPNQMEADLDMNHHDILNAADVRLDDLDGLGIAEAINKEKSERISGDESLGRRIDRERSDREKADSAIASLIGQAGPIEVPSYDTQFAVTFANIKPTINAIRTGGYAAPGDGGAALYKRVPSEPSHGGKVQSADGAWWELAEIAPDFRVFGAKDNGSFENDTAYGNALTYTQAKPGRVLRVRKSDTGIFQFAWRNDFPAPMEIEDGVVFQGQHIQNHINNNVVKGKLILKRTNDPVWPNGFEIYPQPKTELRKAYLTAGDIDYSEVEPVDVTQMLLQRTSWPIITNWVDATTTGISRSADLASFNLETMTATGFVGVHTKAEAGKSYSSSVRFLGTGTLVPACYVRTETRTVVMWFDSSTTNTFKIAFIDHTSGTAQEADVTSIVGDQLGYQFRYAQLGIDVITPYKFSFTLNGVKALPTSDKVSQGLGGEPILHVGWGFYKAGSSLTGSAFVNYPTKTYLFKPPAPRPLRVLVFGDSITAPLTPGWPIYLTELLQGSNGVQIEQLNNIGVSGDTAAQQLEDIQALNLSGYNLAVGMIGTNDIRGQTGISAFKTTMNDIVDLFRNASVPLVLATPPIMYDETEAAAHGGGGFTLSNTERGAPYRDLIMRVVADSRATYGQAIGLVDTLRAMPPVLARYIDWSASGNRVDPLVYDNIHLTTAARKYLANAMACKALAVLTNIKPTRSMSLSSISPAWWRNTWNFYGGDDGTWWVDEQGFKHLNFSALTTSTDPAMIADNIVIMQLPVHMRPLRRVRIAATTGASTVGQILINQDGTVQARGVSAATKYISAQAVYM